VRVSMAAKYGTVGTRAMLKWLYMALERTALESLQHRVDQIRATGTTSWLVALGMRSHVCCAATTSR
jgi:hypothetical protein